MSVEAVSVYVGVCTATLRISLFSRLKTPLLENEEMKYTTQTLDKSIWLRL